MIWLVVTLISLAFYIYYRKWMSSYNHWSKRGIPSIPGAFPWGSYAKKADRKKFQGYAMDDIYYKASEHPYFGYYDYRRPILVLRDPETIQLILVKEFSHFRDRMSRGMPKTDPLLHNQLFSLGGDKWRALRNQLSPTFTSGRMRAMFPLFVNCAEALNVTLLSKQGLILDVKDLIACFTTDVICSCAFGLQTNTISEPDHPLRKAAADFMNAGRSLSNQARFLLRWLFNMPFKKFTPEHVEEYIMKIITETVEFREKNNINRNDFLDLLIELKNKGTLDGTINEEEEPLEINVELMAAQCFLFFIAGYETSSAVQTYCLYELAINPNIQRRLRDEVHRVIEKHSGLSYEAIKEMEYLDMVVSETMRKYPTIPGLPRVCVKSFTTPAGHRIEKGDMILIPVWSLQHDPQYFPSPERFDPERFSPENKGSIKPYTYLPFGEGPRMCIGNRFGLLQTKVGLITVIRNFEVRPCEQTSIPLQLVYSPTNFTSCKGPIMLKMVSLS